MCKGTSKISKHEYMRPFFISKYIQEDKNRNLYGGKSFICMHFTLDIVMVLYSKSCRNLQFKRPFLAM